MNFFEKRRWKYMLKNCDYNLAASVLISKFKGGVIKKELSALFDKYLDNPCLENAVAIIKYAPDFIVIFNECRPSGLFTRQRIYSSSQILNDFLKKMDEADEKEKMRLEIGNKPHIRKVLKLYGKHPTYIEDIFWRLMASGAGKYVAQSVIENAKTLELYLKMKSDGISDLEVATKLSDLLLR